MTQDHHLPPAVEDATPAARHLFTVLRYAEADRLTVRELAQRTGYSLRTIRRATTDLEDRDVLRSTWEHGGKRAYELRG